MVVEGCLHFGSPRYETTVEVNHTEELPEALHCLRLLVLPNGVDFFGEWASTRAGYQVSEEPHFGQAEYALGWINHNTIFLQVLEKCPQVV
jgi:hypothetical protein